MAITREVRIDEGRSARINALAVQVSEVLNGHPATDCELALLSAYCMVAGGVRAYPEATRALRAGLVVNIASSRICDVIREVGEIDDVALLAAARARTCQA